MTLKERICHSVLFEIGGVTLASLAVITFGGAKTGSAVLVGITMATLGTIWNFVYNLLFDKVFTGKRIDRSIGLRIAHAVFFKLGFLCLSVPIVAYLLGWTWLQALLADIGLTVLITVYAFIFNWIFDHLREKFWAKPITV